MEFLRELLFSIVSAVVVAAMIYFWRRTRIPAIVILVAGLALLALPVVIVVDRIWYMSSEGSPAGTIWFVLVASAGLFAALGGIAFAMTGMMRLLGGVESLGLRFVASAGAVAALVFIGFNGYRASRAPPAPKTADSSSSRVEYTEPHRGGKAGARHAAERQRYDECVAYMRESYRRETLKACADELVAAWDSNHAAKTRYANMPDEGGFPASIGALYASYAEATTDTAGALAGIRAVRERSLARYPGDRATLERLDALAAELGR